MIKVKKSPNIALIKYMGKSDSSSNIPTNPSLSYTLKYLFTEVHLSEVDSNKDQWEPLIETSYAPMHLSDNGKQKFLSHLLFLKQKFNMKGFYLIKSGNNFPSDAGIASSASSFAALTEAAYLQARAENQAPEYSEEEKSALSQRGSGSSCRSFFEPYALWKSEGAVPFDPQGSLFKGLLHSVIVPDIKKKQVSSSEAHKRVGSSDLFKGRVERAKYRMNQLIECMNHNNWKNACQICWDEFEDMHQLFETSKPSFMYKTDESRMILKSLKDLWLKNDDGPLVTMDAGSAVHILFRKDQKDFGRDYLNSINKKYLIWSDFYGI